MTVSGGGNNAKTRGCVTKIPNAPLWEILSESVTYDMNDAIPLSKYTGGV